MGATTPPVGADRRSPSSAGRRHRLTPPSELYSLEAFPEIVNYLGWCSEDFERFIRALFASDPVLTMVPRLTSDFGIVGSTLQSRFVRAGLPTPKRYILAALFLRARAVYATGDYSIADIARTFGASSAQSFTRSIRIATGLSAKRFLDSGSVDDAVTAFLDLIRPYTTTLESFKPYKATNGTALVGT